jgi:DNA-binding SARP family transcriptional activator/tetratricopeptide (TPR) repeat protein/TolB-like protein
MHVLNMLGGIGLTDATGNEVRALLRQPKHLALLGYLALPRVGSWHNRDEVVGLLWPETDQTRARSSLRSALHTLRQHLHRDLLISRGDDDISIDPAFFTTDVDAMLASAERGDHQGVLSNYKGELLPGIYVADSAAFDKWLDAERRRLRAAAHRSATLLSRERESENDLAGALDYARRATEIEPDDEASLRRLIAILDRKGDRIQAFAVYERFRERSMEELGIRPSAETVALLDAIRTRHVAQPVDAPIAPPRTALEAQGDVPAQMPEGTPRRRVLPFAITGIALAAVLIAVVVRNRPATVQPAGGSIVILPIRNDTGDPTLTYVATGITEAVAKRLDGLGGFKVVSGARTDWNDSTPLAMKAIGSAFGSRIVVRSTIKRAGDSLEVSASVVDPASMSAASVASRQFSLSSLPDLESRLAADLAGAVFRAPIPTDGRKPVRPVDPESYRLTLEAWHLMLTSGRSDARPVSNTARVTDLFLEAVRIDPGNARAWSGLSSIYTAQAGTDIVPFDEGFERASAAAMRALAIDSLQGTALANLGALLATKHHRLSAGMHLIKKAEAVEPWNAEIFLIEGALLINAHQWDRARDAFRVARKLDPLSASYIDGEARVEMCAGRPQAALELFQAQLVSHPRDHLALRGSARALAALGRYDEALAALRELARVLDDSVLARDVSGAKGEDGYRSAISSAGRRRLAALRRQKGYVSPLRFMQAHFAAGDEENGYRWLDRARDANIRQLYRLQCMPDLDFYRETPRFLGKVREIGSLSP